MNRAIPEASLPPTGNGIDLGRGRVRPFLTHLLVFQAQETRLQSTIPKSRTSRMNGSNRNREKEAEPQRGADRTGDRRQTSKRHGRDTKAKRRRLDEDGQSDQPEKLVDGSRSEAVCVEEIEKREKGRTEGRKETLG